DLLIRALRVARDPLEVRFERGVVINFEVVRRVDVPLELVVVRVVLAEIRHHRGLRPGHGRVAGKPHGGKSGDQPVRQHTRAHRRYLEKSTGRGGNYTESYC